MTQTQLVKRIEELEREMRNMKRKIEREEARPEKSAEGFFGMFRDDPDFKKAMELGAAYRRSLRPARNKARQARKK